MPREWFKISMLGGRKAAISIRGVIGLPKWLEEYGYDAAGTFTDFERELKALGSDIDEIELSVYSPGGSVFDALAMHDVLARHPARVKAVVDGLAASAASFLIMAADEVEIPANAYLMIHNAWGGEMGDHRAMAKMAKDLEKFSGDIAGIYANRICAHTGGGHAAVLADIRAKMDEETWLTGTEAVALGLADTVGREMQLAASLVPFSGLPQAGLIFDTGKMPAELRAVFDTGEFQQAPARGQIANTENMKPKTSDNPGAAIAPTAPVAPVAPVATNAAPAAGAAAAAAAAAAETVAPVAPVAPVAAVVENNDGKTYTLEEARAEIARMAAVDNALQDRISNAVTAASEPLTKKIEELENRLNSGAKDAAWGSGPPANSSQSAAVDGEGGGGESMEGLTPLQLINMGRRQLAATNAAGR